MLLAAMLRSADVVVMKTTMWKRISRQILINSFGHSVCYVFNRIIAARLSNMIIVN